jgi:hypothetical protein
MLSARLVITSLALTLRGGCGGAARRVTPRLDQRVPVAISGGPHPPSGWRVLDARP